jgi:hypothetical protein
MNAPITIAPVRKSVRVKAPIARFRRLHQRTRQRLKQATLNPW